MAFWSILDGHSKMEKVINSCYKKVLFSKKFQEGSQEHGVIIRFLMNLLRIESKLGRVKNIFRKFHQYVEGFVLLSIMLDFNMHVRKGGQKGDPDRPLGDWRGSWMS